MSSSKHLMKGNLWWLTGTAQQKLKKPSKKKAKPLSAASLSTKKPKLERVSIQANQVSEEWCLQDHIKEEVTKFPFDIYHKMRLLQKY